MLKLNHDSCYKAIKSKDARFDGVFYTAVKTTGIYCRPVCKVPAPKAENCTFYKSAAEAEAAGYRPCLRCRPELAPGYSEFGQGKELFRMLEFLTDDENTRLKDRTDLSKYILNKLYEQKAVEYAEMYRPFRSYFTLALWRGDFMDGDEEVKG